MSASLVLPDECAHTQNQFGEMDVDGDLVASASNVAEDVMMLNNGCVCCTVRGDLVKMVGELVSDPDEEESEGGGAEATAGRPDEVAGGRPVLRAAGRGAGQHELGRVGRDP